MAERKQDAAQIMCEDLPKGTVSYTWPLAVNGDEDWVDAVVRQNLQPVFDQISDAQAAAYCAVGNCDTGSCKASIPKRTYTPLMTMPNLVILQVTCEVDCACA